MADKNFHVAPELSAVSAETLMTKAFELTHRIHEQEEHARRSMMPTNRDAWNEGAAEARAERDAIVREMARRSEALERSLAVIEAAERTIVGVIGGHFEQPDDRGDAIDAERAADLLAEVASLTTDTMCSLVKDQELSDWISRRATEYGRRIRGEK